MIMAQFFSASAGIILIPLTILTSQITTSIIICNDDASSYSLVHFDCRNECIPVDTRHSMSESHAIPEYHDEFGLCEIRLKGHLDDRWGNWFGDVTIALEDNGSTLVTCLVNDQAALHGLLKKIRNLGMPLLSVNFVNPGQVRPQEDKQ
jgi:hypothetical protein